MTSYVQPQLDDGDLERLTGYVRAADQTKWLRENGIPFTVNREGRPRTTWGLVEEALRGNDGYGTPGKVA